MKSKFNQLFKITNQILNNSSDHDALHAISFLNNIKIDEFTYRKLEILKKKNFYILSISLLVFNFIKFVTRSIIFLLTKSNKKKSNKKYLFLSGFANKSEQISYFENFFYFNDIKKKSQNLYFQTFSQQFLDRSGKNIPLQYLSLSDELKILKEILVGFKFIYSKFFLEKKILQKKIYIYCLSSIFSGDTHITLRNCLSLKNFILHNKIKKIITLYEGHGYERLIAKYVRKINFCETIAYQQTGISRFQNNILKIHNKSFYPNKILVLSQLDKLKLEKKNKKSEIFNIGKNRQNTRIRKWKELNNQLLVFLTTSTNESKKIIDLIVNSNFKNFNLIIRPHPNSKFNNKKFIKRFFTNCDKSNINYSISINKHLADDLKKCSIALISSGSSLINCIDCGVFPIIYKTREIIDTPANNNPKIFKFVKNKYEVNNFLKKEKINISKFNFKKASIFSHKYFNNINYHQLKKILK